MTDYVPPKFKDFELGFTPEELAIYHNAPPMLMHVKRVSLEELEAEYPRTMTEPLADLQSRLKEYAAPNHGDMWTGVRFTPLPFRCTCGVLIERPEDFTRPHQEHERNFNPSEK